MKNKKTKKDFLKNSGHVSGRGQILPGVLLTGALLAILGYTMLGIFQNENKMMVRSMDIMRKQELANTALEHARYKIQTGSFWYQLPLEGFLYDKEYTVQGLGSYAIHIAEGNLFLNLGVRQGKTSFRTIGIKVKVSPSKDTKQFYAVVKRVGYGGPLISKGRIDLPCTQDAAANNRYNFYWGDVYSANPADGACQIPVIPVGRGTASPQHWSPSVYAAGNIYTAVGKSGATFSFNYTYDDMSPTARTHPYSSYAKAPALTLNTYKQLAKEQGGYYGPATIGTTGEANPYYIDSNHDLADLSALTIAAHLTSSHKVLFIDTVDALPVRLPANSSDTSNTYCGTTYTSAGTIALYTNCKDQYYTVGSLIVQGPLTLKGDNPATPLNNCANLANKTKDPFASGWPCTWASAPDNYYFPQIDDGKHYDADSNKGDTLQNIKHAGFLYVDGELRIGGVRCGLSSSCDNHMAPRGTEYASAGKSPEKSPFSFLSVASKLLETAGFLLFPGPVYAGGPSPSCPTAFTTASDIAIYGTVYIGEHGALTVDTVNDPNASFHFYYNEGANAFGFLQQNVVVTSFKEITFLVPTPMPAYPVF